MPVEKEWPVVVVDTETDPPWPVVRYKTRADAEWYLNYLRIHGGTAARKKLERGGYEIRGGK